VFLAAFLEKKYILIKSSLLSHKVNTELLAMSSIEKPANLYLPDILAYQILRATPCASLTGYPESGTIATTNSTITVLFFRGGVGALVGLTVFKTAGGPLCAVSGGFDSHTPLPNAFRLIQNQIILMFLAGDIFSRVINDLVCSNRARHFHVF
jgi:hypothetical protein